ncbi:MAG: hypothetical protein OXO49_08400 [Gammaproteobacteria bacterium]|nr:hypothetical protein [Gammaproteobacteria bacterium]MDE0252964.1 hypothetical protein [Gammaproteobacteria bacterium]MDE0403647.1 hypothetical protein [Gammaproteobacteria bacterium]
MKNARKTTIWLTASGLALLVLGISVFILLPTAQPITPTNLVTPTASTAFATTEEIPPDFHSSSPAEHISPPLPPVDYPPDSIGEACGLNEFPPYHWYGDLDFSTARSLENSPFDSAGEWKLDKKCLTALEQHIYPINPYLWDKHKLPNWSGNAFSFVDINNPLTFERIFADPVGDFVRVQEALARPECLLGKDADPNWNLHETCYADAIHNYALLTRFCYGNGLSLVPRKYYWKDDDPTPAQDRGMWIQALTSAWVDLKCESLDPLLDLGADLHTDLREQILALHNEPEEPDAVRSQLREHFVSDSTTNSIEDFFRKIPQQFNSKPQRLEAEEILIELAARLGDTAAGLTQPFNLTHQERGYKFGRYANWFSDIEPNILFFKEPPSVDRVYGALSLFASPTDPDLREHVVNIDLDALVQHLCTPPYYDEPTDPPSCQSVINDLRQNHEVQNNTSILERLTTFEKIARRLDVYE